MAVLHNVLMSAPADAWPLFWARQTRLSSWTGLAVGCLMLAQLGACAPNLNWRDVSPEHADGLAALFPCQPEVHDRQVAWSGIAGGVSMRLMSCQADGRTWSLSYMTLPDADRIGPALLQWPELTRTNLVAAARLAASADPVVGHDLGPVSVPHMTPMTQAHAWHFQGQRPDGLGRPMAMDVQAWHFSHGMTVFEASVAGAADQAKGQSSEDVAQAFFHGFHFPG